MSQLELDRMEILQRVIDKRLPQTHAVGILGLTVRHTRRLVRALDADGAAGLISKRRGKPSNYRLSDDLKLAVLDLIRAHYADFGPTLANEKILEIHGLTVSTETVRTWMSETGLWVPRKRRRNIHLPRQRRECFGELVQIDGSDHAWFEDRAPRCTLLVYIDDATSRLLQLQFVKIESAFDDFEATRMYMTKHGKPIAFYSDRHMIFRAPDSKKKANGGGQTQFGRALSQLNVDIICANSPQAKGRVERANRTLQDRLVKELRLRGISTIAQGNTFLPSFLEAHNARFAKPPRNPRDAHRAVRPSEDLDEIFTWQEQRKISKDLVVQYKRKKYHIAASAETKEFAESRCQILEWADGRLVLRSGGIDLPFSCFDPQQRVTQAAIVENKHLGAALEVILERQNERDLARLESQKMTVREKDQLREQMVL